MVNLKKMMERYGSEEIADVPEEGGEFRPTGFIGPYHAGVFRTFYYDHDFTMQDDIPMPDLKRMTNSGGVFVHYRDPALALQASNMLNREYDPHSVWRLEVDRDKVINFSNAEARERFSNPIASECRMSTLRSKYRYQFHMIALPSFVSAVARMCSLDVPEFNTDGLVELTRLSRGLAESESPLDDIKRMDELELELVGGDDQPWKGSYLWRQRASIWDALGEGDATKWKPDGTGKASTKSDDLSAILSMALNPMWKDPLWMRVASVDDPVASNAWERDGVQRRQWLPVILDCYEGESKAQAAAEEDKARFSNGGGEDEVDFGMNAKPVLPADWEGAGEESFVSQVIQPIIESGDPAPVAYSNMGGDGLGATLQQVVSWVNHVKNQ